MLYGLCFLFLVRKHHSGRGVGIGQQGVLSSIAGPSYLRRLRNWRGQPALPSLEAVAQRANGSLQSVTAGPGGCGLQSQSRPDQPCGLG